jgi:hypothetical protein
MFCATGPRVLLVLLLGILLFGPAPSAAKVGASQTPPFDCATVTQIPLTECEALVALYANTGGPNWRDNTGWLQTNMPCSWFGITCDADHVSRLDERSNSTRLR